MRRALACQSINDTNRFIIFLFVVVVVVVVAVDFVRSNFKNSTLNSLLQGQTRRERKEKLNGCAPPSKPKERRDENIAVRKSYTR